MHLSQLSSPLFPYTTLFRSQIEAQNDVVDVHIAKTFEHTLNSSKDLVQAKETWEEYGLKGEGLLVAVVDAGRSEEHTSELQSRGQLVCRLLLEKKKIFVALA